MLANFSITQIGKEVINLTKTCQGMKILKLNIIVSLKPLGPSIPATEDSFPRATIPEVDAAISAAPISKIRIQSVAMQAEVPDKLNLLSSLHLLKHVAIS